MPGNSFGQAFRITTAGESHGPGNLVIVDGCPPGLSLSTDDLLPDLARRRPGQSAIVTQRDEPDAPEILSGVFEGKTTGTSIAILIRNRDQRSRDYSAIQDKYRPGTPTIPTTRSTASATTAAAGGRVRERRRSASRRAPWRRS